MKEPLALETMSLSLSKGAPSRDHGVGAPLPGTKKGEILFYQEPLLIGAPRDA
jgi:hypothetical protein